jgi:hypothetical protein
VPYAISGSSPITTDGVSVYLCCLGVVIVGFLALSLISMATQLPVCLGGVAYKHGTRSSKPLLTLKSAWIMVRYWPFIDQRRTHLPARPRSMQHAAAAAWPASGRELARC